MSTAIVTCACCPKPATGVIWDTNVCDVHWAIWSKESPYPKDIEAKAKPEHFDETHHGRQLKPDLLARWYRAWTAKWVERQRQVAA